MWLAHILGQTRRVDQHHVVAAILRRDERVLLCHRSPGRQWYPGVWDFPGGHVEQGEQPNEALRRELLEEIGVEIGPALSDPVQEVFRPKTGLHLTLWLVTDWVGNLENRQLEEHDHLGWFGVKELCRVAQQLVAAGENVVDVPPTLTARRSVECVHETVERGRVAADDEPVGSGGVAGGGMDEQIHPGRQWAAGRSGRLGVFGVGVRAGATTRPARRAGTHG